MPVSCLILEQCAPCAHLCLKRPFGMSMGHTVDSVPGWSPLGFATRNTGNPSQTSTSLRSFAQLFGPGIKGNAATHHGFLIWISNLNPQRHMYSAIRHAIISIPCVLSPLVPIDGLICEAVDVFFRVTISCSRKMPAWETIYVSFRYLSTSEPLNGLNTCERRKGPSGRSSLQTCLE
jgi:hypothetical protein